MMSVPDALRAYQRGELTFQELLAEIDRIVADGRADPQSMLAALAEEGLAIALPSEVRDAVGRRIEEAAAARASRLDGDVLSGATGPGATGGEPYVDHIRLASTEDVAGGDPVRNPLKASGEPPSGVADGGPAGLGEPDRLGSDQRDRRASGEAGSVSQGDTIKSRFVLEERLGTGGMGTVYKALDLVKEEAKDRNPYVAIKVLNDDFRDHPEAFIALQREAKKAQSLAHPNIVTVYDFDRDGSTIFMTMEFLSGSPLDRLTKASGFQGLPVEEALQIVRGIGAAVGFAHENGIVHSDLKPGNVFLGEDREVTVIDFGIARAVKRTDDSGEDVTRFDAGSLGALTPAYASPEMLAGLGPDLRDDIFALACITYELLTGAHPFRRMPAPDAKHAGIQPKKPKVLNGGQWKALQRGLAFDHDKRTPSIGVFQEGLDQGRYSLGRVAAYGGLAAAFAIVALGAGYYLWPPPPKIAAPTPEPPPPNLVRPDRPPVPKPAPPPEGKIPRIPDDPQPPPPAPNVPPNEPLVAAIARLLGVVPCSMLEATAKDGTVSIRGYAKSMSDVSRLRNQLMLRGDVTEVDEKVQSISDDDCKLMRFFYPYVTTNRDSSFGLSIETRNPEGEYVENERLVVDLQSPSYESYVYVDYFALDGSVVHLFPNPTLRQNRIQAGARVTLGDAGSAKQWVIGTPFGTEMIVVLASPVPLFDSPRPDFENRLDYLSELEQGLERAARGGGGPVTGTYAFITTRAKR